MLSRRDFVLASTACSLPLSALDAQSGPAHYLGNLTLRPLSDGRMMELQEPFGYVDAGGHLWNVPATAVVDGASIPSVFWPITGGPWEGRYRAASVVHDWFCAVRTERWQQVHRMFYEAMLTSHVAPQVARMMFLAVRFAGPSWDELTMRNARILTRNGMVRLEPPGRRPSVNGFFSGEEEADARATITAQLQWLSDQANRRDLGPDAMEQLVDRNGREEYTASMLK